MKKDNGVRKLAKLLEPAPGYMPLYKLIDFTMPESSLEYANRLKKYIARSEKTYDLATTKEKLGIYKELFYKNEAGKEIFDKILSDAECLQKVVFVDDGSYRTHRIWFDRRTLTLFIEIYDEKFQYTNSMYSITGEPEEALKAFYTIIESFEKIFLQLDTLQGTFFEEGLIY